MVMLFWVVPAFFACFHELYGGCYTLACILKHHCDFTSELVEFKFLDHFNYGQDLNAFVFSVVDRLHMF